MQKTIRFSERLSTFYKYPSVCLYQDRIEDPNDFVRVMKTPSSRKRQQMIYIHIPYCDSMCVYCPFYKVRYRSQSKEAIKQFVDCLLQELEQYSREPFFEKVRIANVQFGGGSPLTLDTQYLLAIIEKIRECYTVDHDVEISLEGNPRNLQEEDKLNALMGVGMTRVSFGIQTFNEALRRKLGIGTDIRDVYRAVDVVKKLGIKEFACDLMYNLPEQNANEIRYNVDRVAEMAPAGVDFYDLNVFPNTKMYDWIEKGKFRSKPSNQNEVRHFEAGLEAFAENNYELVRSYVFRRRDRDAPPKNSVLYSFNSDMLAVGPSARGTLYSNGLNYRNCCSIESYVKALVNGRYPIEAGNVVSEELLDERDTILFPYFLKIERSKVDNAKYGERLRELTQSGYVHERDGYIELTDSGRIWSGNVSYHLHSEREKERIANTVMSCIGDKRNIFNQDRMNCDSSSEASSSC